MKVSILLLLLSTSIGFAQSKLVSSANNFLSTLNDNTKAKAVFSLDDVERYNFYFVPREKREGACFKFLTIGQRQAALSLLNTFLSEAGYKKATEIMALETILKEIEKRSA